MSVLSLGIQHLTLRSAEDVHEVFQRLGYDVYDPEPFEGDDLDQLDLDDADRETVNRAYVVARRDNHTVYLYEVSDLRQTRLRGLAWHALQRGTALLAVTRDYREILFVDPRFVGKPNKSSVRVNKLKLVSSDPTRHDLDTLNAIHAHRRTGQQVYDAQAEAFNVNRVTNKFYREYRDYFHRVQDVVVAWNKGIAEFQNSDQRDKLHAFVQRLMGRLMFLYFLQRKGWLGGRSDFLTWQYRQMVNRHAGELSDKSSYYYREVLEPLFFDTLNKKRPDNWTQWGVKIPYLNGGLFDKSRDPDGMIILPDALFDPNSNTGLLAFFNRYNFTITDDAPMEQDVAVDPEMLGKVFENMLEEEDRGQSGSFYTPRTIVSYMCQEALAGYLEESAGIPREETRRHFDPDDDITFTEEQAQSVSDALDTLTVLDPAVGSGSFLIGMLNEIITLRHRVAAALNQTVTPELIAEWKEAIIRDTLYGVDIKPGAIEIAQLRLWLSLVVNQTMADAKPLPNLDYKLMAGNSLIETIDGEPILTTNAQNMLNSTTQPQQLNMFTTAAEENRKLEDLRDEYFHATPEERKQLAADIRFQERRIIEAGLNDMLEAVQQRISQIEKKYQLEGIQWKNADAKKYAELLAKAERLQTIKRDLWDDEATLPFFLYRLHFNDVFAHKGGFDVVVANPPYVRGDKLGDQKDEFKATDIYKPVYSGTADLYVYFYVRALDLLKKRGNMAFITSNKFIRAKYGTGLRAYLAEHANMREMIDFGELPVFKEAATFPYILLAEKDKPRKKTLFTQVQAWGEFDSVRGLVEENGEILPETAINRDDWTLTDHATAKLLNKLSQAGTPLGEYVNGQIYMGLKTGFNAAFVIDAAKRDELIAQDPKSAEIIKPYAVGDDVRKWQIHQDKWLIVTQIGVDIERYPAIFAHLSQWQDKLEVRYDKGNHWWELRACAYYEAFEKPKIVYPDIAKELRFSFDTQQTYFGNTVYMLAVDDLYLAGILNSNLLWYYVKANFAVLGDPNAGGRFRFFTQSVEQIPIPNVPDDLRGKIANLAQQCLDAAKNNPDKLPALEAELNQLVYQAYGLDADDIAVIEGYLAGKQAVAPLDMDEGTEDEE